MNNKDFPDIHFVPSAGLFRNGYLRNIPGVIHINVDKYFKSPNEAPVFRVPVDLYSLNSQYITFSPQKKFLKLEECENRLEKPQLSIQIDDSLFIHNFPKNPQLDHISKLRKEGYFFDEKKFF